MGVLCLLCKSATQTKEFKSKQNEMRGYQHGKSDCEIFLMQKTYIVSEEVISTEIGKYSYYQIKS